MKFCVKSRQPLSLLRKADEIRVEYRDIEQLLDFFQQLTDKTYLITIPGDNEFDQDFIMMCHEKSNIILEITKIDLSIIKWCAEKNIKWYWYCSS
jgi:archaellum biogenesis ATPase FlaH